MSICKEDGAFLRRLAERYGEVRLRVCTTDINEPRTSWNVIADPLGRGKPDEMVIVGCHHDGHDISQGAHNPASGMVSVIEASQVLSQYAANILRRTVRFIAFGTEEIGLTGAYRYIEGHENELENMRFLLNMDAAGGSSRKGVGLHQWSKLETFFKQAAREMATQVPLGQKVNSYSDRFPFVLKGIPSGDMSDPEAPPHGRGFGHTAYDTLDKVELENLRKASAVGAQLALRLANAEEFPAQHRSGKAIQEAIDTAPGLEGYRVSSELAERRAR